MSRILSSLLSSVGAHVAPWLLSCLWRDLLLALCVLVCVRAGVRRRLLLDWPFHLSSFGDAVRE